MAWQAINIHLGTDDASLQELVAELGKLRFGHAGLLLFLKEKHVSTSSNSNYETV